MRAASLAILPLLLLACSGGRDPRPVRPEARDSSPAGPMLAEAAAEFPSLKVQVLELRQADGRLRVTLAFVHLGREAGPFRFGSSFAAAAADAGTIADVSVIDPLARKKYFVLRAGDGRPICSAGLADLRPGERRVVWISFPALPTETRRVTLVVPHVPPFSNLPIS